MPLLLRLFEPAVRQYVNQLKDDHFWNHIKNFARFLLLLLFVYSFTQIILLSMTLYIQFYGNTVLNRLLLFDLLIILWILLFPFFIYSRISSSFGFLYQAADTSYLQSLPVSYSQLFWRNFLEGYSPILVFKILTLLPVLIAYGKFFEAAWLYYLVIFPALVLFSIIPQAIGTLIPLVLMRASSFFKNRRLFYWVSLSIFLSFIYILRVYLRLNTPNDQNWVAVMAKTIGNLKGSILQNTPIVWMNEFLMAALLSSWDLATFWHLFYFVASSVLALIILNWVAANVYFKGLTIAQEGTHSHLENTKRLALFSTWPFYLKPFRQIVSILIKDILMFFRDISQWSQLLLLMIFFTAYLFIFNKMSLQQASINGTNIPLVSEFFIFFISGTLQTTIGVRFVFPLFSMESKASWLLRVAPLSPAFVLISKFIFGFLLIYLFSAAENIILVTMINRFGWNKMPYYEVILLGQSLFFTSLALYMGLRFPKYEFKNSAAISASFGGMLYSVIGIVVILGSSGLLCLPLGLNLHLDNLWWLYELLFSFLWLSIILALSLMLMLRALQLWILETPR